MCKQGMVKGEVLKIQLCGFGQRCLLESGSFQTSPVSRGSREFADSESF